ncbi:MAG: nucleotide exchange factor GrpE [Acidimicrobiales bacterium]|jgi:molecular chaperone GrpE
MSPRRDASDGSRSRQHSGIGPGFGPAPVSAPTEPEHVEEEDVNTRQTETGKRAEVRAEPEHVEEEDVNTGQAEAGTRPTETGKRSEVSAEVAQEDLEAALTLSRRERDEYFEMLRRLQADFENYKKRMLRQQTDLLERAAQGLVVSLLPVLDAFDLARAHLGDATNPSPEGKALVQAAALLFDTLSKEGLERVSDTDAPFDPTAHEAVEHEPVDHETSEATGGGVTQGEAKAEDDAEAAGPVVVAVLRVGYRWKGRVIRPAMVRVRG